MDGEVEKRDRGMRVAGLGPLVMQVNASIGIFIA